MKFFTFPFGISRNYISDLQLVLRLIIFTFQSDVNTVTFADETGQILYSGSDDDLCKVNSSILEYFLDFYGINILNE